MGLARWTFFYLIIVNELYALMYSKFVCYKKKD